MILYHAANVYESNNKSETDRMGRAQKTWAQLYGSSSGMIRPASSKMGHYTRSAKDIGDNRDVPFVKDVIEYAIRKCGDQDAVMLTNADSSICQKAGDYIFQGLFDWETCYSGRQNMEKIYRVWLSQSDIMERGNSFIGVDLVAFTKKWWETNKESIPDLLLSYQGWDWVYKFIIGQEKIVGPVIYHEEHQTPYWFQNQNIAMGNHYNRKLCVAWAKAQPNYDEILKLWPTLKEYEKIQVLPQHARRYRKDEV